MQSEETQGKETDQEHVPIPDTVESVSLDIEENPESFGRSKQKRIPRQAETDTLNECLCGLVVKPSSEGALLCKKKGCETQWVRSVVTARLGPLTARLKQLSRLGGSGSGAEQICLAPERL